MSDLNKLTIEENFERLKDYINKKQVGKAKNLIKEMKLFYPEDSIVDMFEQYLIAQTFTFKSKVKFINWEYKKKKIQAKIDNFNNKGKLKPLPKMISYLYEYVQAKKQLTEEKLYQYARIIIEIENVFKLREEVYELQALLTEKYEEEKTIKESIFKKLFSKK